MCIIVLANHGRSANASPDSHQVPPLFDKVFKTIVRAHEPAGGIVAHLWHLPDSMARVISSHHAVPRGKDNAMVAAVCIADWMATDLGFLVQRDVEPYPKEAMHALGVSEDIVNDIRLLVRGIVARID
jgi:hypothetical protein